ncbi:MAG TPA: thiamine diphosphokinase [Flavobacteriia bacterium]|nr:thiamine diphosphokinase [Flavobacteriia bacterium]
MKNTKKAFLLLNGELPNQLSNLQNYDLICATDGALHKLEKFNKIPDLLTGDFDSSTNHPKNIEIIPTPDQEDTDFGKMLQILFNKGFKNIDIYGASGLEQDHFLGNLNSALVWKNRLELTFYDNHSTYFFAKNKTILKNVKGKLISLYPFSKAKKITTKGLQYPLKKEALKIGKRIGIRNFAIESDVKITFKKGNLLIFIHD